MASLLDISTEPTSGLQNFAIFIVIFFPALALLVIVLRDAGRLASHQFGLDDWLISIAMLFSIGETIVSYFFIRTNFIGIHEVDIPPHDPTNGQIWNYAVQILYNPILALVKSSVLCFLLRLFGQKKGIRRFIIGLNLVNLMQMVGVFFAILFQCTPIAFNWDPTIKGGHCVQQRILFTFTAVFNIVTDLMVLGLPLWIFLHLNIPKRTKIPLIFVFLLGFLVTITSVIRMVLIIQLFFGFLSQNDMTFSIGFVVSAIETNLALITASAPALRPFLRARERGGWLPSFGRSPDVEMASAAPYSFASTGTGIRGGYGGSGKFSRGGARGGRRGSNRRGRGGRKPITIRDIRVKTERELRSQSPRSSEEEAMTSNGIMRISDIQREIDGIAREMSVGPGTYGGSGERGRATGRGGAGRRYPERYYSESVYPDVEYRGERDFNEERLSRYGEKRFGVVTPKTSTARFGDNGRPF